MSLFWNVLATALWLMCLQLNAKKKVREQRQMETSKVDTTIRQDAPPDTNYFQRGLDNDKKAYWVAVSLLRPNGLFSR